MKIAFFTGPAETAGYFLRDIMAHLALRHEIKVYPVIDKEAVCAQLEWADIAWVEWADMHAALVSRMPKRCPVVLRLHSYEAFATKVLTRIKWSGIDKIIFVSPAIKNIFFSNFHALDVKNEVVFNAINIDTFTLKKSFERTYKIANVTISMNPEKNIPFVLQCFHAMAQKEKRLSLHMTGTPYPDSVVHQRTQVYLHHMIKELKLEGRVFFAGRIPPERMNDWLEDKDMLLSGSFF
ncbi:hypothetical protein LJC23_01050 [Desulfovibrio sp. OttesenSCG-928-I05]|nr:hypothetical protein [Desulfovibrio sp. OttesenSCG-928-I05]